MTPFKTHGAYSCTTCPLQYCTRLDEWRCAIWRFVKFCAHIHTNCDTIPESQSKYSKMRIHAYNLHPNCNTKSQPCTADLPALTTWQHVVLMNSLSRRPLTFQRASVTGSYASISAKHVYCQCSVLCCLSLQFTVSVVPSFPCLRCVSSRNFLQLIDHKLWWQHLAP